MLQATASGTVTQVGHGGAKRIVLSFRDGC